MEQQHWNVLFWKVEVVFCDWTVSVAEELDPFWEEQIELKSTLDFFPPSFDEVPSKEIKEFFGVGNGRAEKTKDKLSNHSNIFFSGGPSKLELFILFNAALIK